MALNWNGAYKFSCKLENWLTQSEAFFDKVDCVKQIRTFEEFYWFRRKKKNPSSALSAAIGSDLRLLKLEPTFFSVLKINIEWKIRAFVAVLVSYCCISKNHLQEMAKYSCVRIHDFNLTKLNCYK